MNTEYQVKLDAFEGPLDLLLFLIRRAEVEITDIPVSTIADQYLEFLGSIDSIDIDRAGEFLVLAATLTEIKARMLAPPPPSDAPAEGEGGAPGVGGKPGGYREVDPRAELVKQLLEYKRYRDAAEALDQRKHEWESRYPIAAATQAAPPPPTPEEAAAAEEEAARGPAVDVEDLNLADLIEAFSRILATVDLNRVGEHRVVVDDTPIELHAEDLLDRLQREMGDAKPADWRGLPLQAVFTGRTRGEAIGLFLAMLELVRQRKIEVVQDAPRAEILIRPGKGDDNPAAT